GKDLIRPQRGVVHAGPMVTVDDIEQAIAFLVPEPLLEPGARPYERLGPALGPRAGDVQRVQPQRLDLDRLPDARRHHPIADLRIHPGELYARLAGGEQSVRIGVNAITRAALMSVE